MNFPNFVKWVDEHVKSQLGAAAPTMLPLEVHRARWQHGGREVRLLLQSRSKVLIERVELNGEVGPLTEPISMDGAGAEKVRDEVIWLFHAHTDDAILERREGSADDDD